MSDAPTQSDLITELKASAHLMRLDPGVYCVYHSEGSQLPDAQTGLPGARLTLPPGPNSRGVVISGLGDDGWIAVDSASLIRVSQGPAHVLMTVYQMPGSGHEAPKMQVRRLVEGVATHQAPAAAPPASIEDQSTVNGGGKGAVAPEPEIAAHVQLRGDMLARVGDWIGDRGSKRWIEGFAIAPRGEVPIEDIEYQAVLGRGWLSPWAEGGQYCGSRGMALPILGLRARLRGPSALSHTIDVSATFTDGSAVGPVAAGDPCEADSLAPLEAFQVIMRPIGEQFRNPVGAAAKADVARTKPVRAARKPLAEIKPAAPTPTSARAATKAPIADTPPAQPAGKAATGKTASVKRAPLAVVAAPTKPAPRGSQGKGRAR